MAPGKRSRLLPPAIAAVLLVLLVLLAALQYHWIGRVSRAEHRRLEARLAADGDRFAEDVDRELTRAFLYFHPDFSQTGDEAVRRAASQLERWRADAPWPDFVRDLLVARRSGRSTELFTLRSSGALETAAWTPELAEVRGRLLAGPDDPVGHDAQEITKVRSSFPFLAPIDTDIPGLVLPLSFARRGSAPESQALLVVRLNTAALADEILPELTRRHFGDRQGSEYAVAVLDSSGTPVFRSDAAVPLESFRKADLRLDVLRLRPFHELRSLWVRRQEKPGEDADAGLGLGLHRRSPQPPEPRAGLRVMMPGPDDRRRTDTWTLVAHHRRGSLEAAVARVRFHNLGMSLCILALMAVTSGLMVVTTHRAQRLARQQMEFVAGVTHELHTPLTAIRSAGQNLADGVVADPQQVKRYGALVEREGRRLSDMVAQALELAGIQSGRRVYHPRPEEIALLVDGALEDCRPLIEESRTAVTVAIPAGLPPVLADGEALRRALRNLIENAVRHGRPANGESRVGIQVRTQERMQARTAEPGKGAGRVEITVSDHGAGIRREDLPHLFEPFFRGREAAVNGIAGSGVGLSLVRHVAEALGGRVTVATGPEGSAFTISLPFAPAAPAAPGETRGA